MNLTAHLPAGRRQHVEARLHGKLLAWLTTVRPDGQPDTVPVWFLVRDDDTILIYSRPGRERPGCATRENPHVALGLDVTDIGRDVIRQDALLAVHGDVQPPGQDVPGIVGFPVPVQRRPGEPRAELHLDHTEPFVGLCPPSLIVARVGPISRARPRPAARITPARPQRTVADVVHDDVEAARVAG